MTDAKHFSMYHVARQCATAVTKGLCPGDCNSCYLNIGHYASKEDAGLIHAEAMVDAQQEIFDRGVETKTTLVKVIILAICCLVFYTKCVAPKPDPTGYGSGWRQSVGQDFYVLDIGNNGVPEGTINCTDYAVCFKYFWDFYHGPGSEARLITAFNYKYDWYHMLVRLPDGRLIDPAAVNGDKYYVAINYDCLDRAIIDDETVLFWERYRRSASRKLEPYL